MGAMSLYYFASANVCYHMYMTLSPFISLSFFLYIFSCSFTYFLHLDFFHEYERQLHERTKELNLRERSIAEKEKEIQRRMQFLMDSEEWLRTRWDKLMEREQVVLTTNKVSEESKGERRGREVFIYCYLFLACCV